MIITADIREDARKIYYGLREEITRHVNGRKPLSIEDELALVQLVAEKLAKIRQEGYEEGEQDAFSTAAFQDACKP